MTTDALKTTAEKLVANCREHREKQGIDELYAPDAMSVEATSMPGSDSREVRGVEGIKGKHDWFDNTFDVHDQQVDGPYLHGDKQFAVIFAVNATNKENGERAEMKEVAVYTIDDAGKIVREEFFY